MIKLLTISLFSCLALTAHSRSYQAQQISTITGARTVEQLDSDLRRLRGAHADRVLCRAELRADRVPIHCLSLLGAREKEKDSEQARWRAMISRLCVRAVGQLDQVAEIRTLLSKLYTDKVCFEAASRRKERLEYMHPELITESIRND